MRSPESLRTWTQRILVTQSGCAQQAAWELLRALLCTFTTQLSQLARQADRAPSTKVTRQFFARLARPHWEPTQIYAELGYWVRPIWRGRKRIPLLVDITHVGGCATGWSVLQVSLPWQRRALPVLRLVLPRALPAVQQTEWVLAACDLLTCLLPGTRGRYVLVMDRGFPSKWLLNELQGRGWRSGIRINDGWRVTHPQFAGLLQEARQAGQVGPRPRLLAQAHLGWRHTGPSAARHSSQVQVVWYWGLGHREPWFLVTSERRASRVVALYRERMQIEAEFRDIKGPLGLDLLGHWLDADAVASFLAWVAVYEWRLACLWVAYRLATWAAYFQAHGPLSWIRITREWLARQLRPPKSQAHACL